MWWCGVVWCGVVQSSHVTEIRSQIIQTVGRGLEKDFIFISILDISTFFVLLFCEIIFLLYQTEFQFIILKPPRILN